MHLTDDQIRLIRDSYELLVPEIERVSKLFYEDLFRRLPKVRSLFVEDIGEQGMRFMSAIGFIIGNLEDEAKLNARLDALASRHAPYKLLRSDYRQMEEALIDTLAHALKAKFTNEVELAWRGAFSQVCDAIVEKSGLTGY